MTVALKQVPGIVSAHVTLNPPRAESVSQSHVPSKIVRMRIEYDNAARRLGLTSASFACDGHLTAEKS